VDDVETLQTRQKQQAGGVEREVGEHADLAQ